MKRRIQGWVTVVSEEACSLARLTSAAEAASIGDDSMYELKLVPFKTSHILQSQSGFGEEQKVVVLVGLSEVVLLDEVEAGALDFGDDDFRVDAVVVAVAGVVDDGEACAGFHRCEE